MLKIELTKRADKFIDSLPAKQKRRVTLKIIELRSNPRPHDAKQLKGDDQMWRADVGEYRIVYFVRDSVLLVIFLVGNRNDDEI